MNAFTYALRHPAAQAPVMLDTGVAVAIREPGRVAYPLGVDVDAIRARMDAYAAASIVSGAREGTYRVPDVDADAVRVWLEQAPADMAALLDLSDVQARRIAALEDDLARARQRLGSS